jgi:hypothetical protein
MTDEQIIEIAKRFSMTSGGKYFVPDKDIIAFARLIEAKVREEDVVICERYMHGDGELNEYWLHGLAAAIRNSGGK